MSMPKRPVVGGHARKMVAKLLSHPTAKESMVKVKTYEDDERAIHRVLLTFHIFLMGWEFRNATNLIP